MTIFEFREWIESAIPLWAWIAFVLSVIGTAWIVNRISNGH